jgi:hypothetical protein
MNLLEELETRNVCGDGAMGTLLLDRGVPVDRCLEELCVSEPDRIRAIHDEYVAAGARVIETNTFGANAVRLARFGFENRIAEINPAFLRLGRADPKRPNASRHTNIFTARCLLRDPNCRLVVGRERGWSYNSRPVFGRDRNVKCNAGKDFWSLDPSAVENVLGQLTESRGTDEDRF